MIEANSNLYVVRTAGISHHAIYHKKEGTLLGLVLEATEKKAHRASGMGLFLSGGKELKIKRPHYPS
jgi:hypothetical protein